MFFWTGKSLPCEHISCPPFCSSGQGNNTNPVFSIFVQAQPQPSRKSAEWLRLSNKSNRPRGRLSAQRAQKRFHPKSSVNKPKQQNKTWRAVLCLFAVALLLFFAHILSLPLDMQISRRPQVSDVGTWRRGKAYRRCPSDARAITELKIRGAQNALFPALRPPPPQSPTPILQPTTKKPAPLLEQRCPIHGWAPFRRKAGKPAVLCGTFLWARQTNLTPTPQ
jgi:hypothetical protein